MPAPVTHFLPLTTIRRARLLTAPGRVLVRPGQQVSTNDPVAETFLPDAHLLLDIRRTLGIPSINKAEQTIQRKVGDKLQKGDVIAETGGLFSKVIRAPSNGTIIAISNGQVMLESETLPQILRAGMPGVISEVVDDRGVILETSGLLVQGAWGNGRADMGLLLALARSADEELTRDRLDVSMRGAVVLAGYCAQADVLKVGADLPLRGLILSSISPDLINLANSMKYPIVVIEGFGRIAMNDLVFKLLTTNEKRDVSVNAVPWDRFSGDRPEVIIPLPSDSESAPETDEFRPGQKVRIQGSPYTGQTAVIVALRPGQTLLPNGLRAPAADLRLESNERLLIPLSNLDVLE